MERSQHHLLHSNAGDIWGQYSGPASDPASTLIGNILVVAHLDKRKAAISLCEAVQQAGLKRAVVIPWQKAITDAKSKSMWAVCVHNVTPIEVALARPFVPERKVPQTPASIRTPTKNTSARRNFRSSGARIAAGAAQAQHVAERVSAMPAATFAFLLGTDDTDAATAKRDAFAAHLRNGDANADWRREWSAWVATGAPTTVAVAAPAEVFLAQLRTLKAI